MAITNVASFLLLQANMASGARLKVLQPIGVQQPFGHVPQLEVQFSIGDSNQEENFGVPSSNHTPVLALVSGNGDVRRMEKYGDPACPCIGIDGVSGGTTAIIKEGNTFQEAKYPADLGARCDSWDDGHNPNHCMEGQHPGKGNGWCAKEWCYVDPCNCAIDVTPKLAIYVPYAQNRARPIYYSYATCGNTDERTAMINPNACVNRLELNCATDGKCLWNSKKSECVGKEILGACNDPDFNPDEKVWGQDSCPCIGLNNIVGTTDVEVGNSTLAYPADAGSVCKAWDDNDKHPECSGSNAPSWCKKSWCFVDPCNCKLETAPKLSSYLPSSTFRGRPVHYSYATCGSVDSWAAEHQDDVKKHKHPSFTCSGATSSTLFSSLLAIVMLANLAKCADRM
jgi:hypothetical protein